MMSLLRMLVPSIAASATAILMVLDYQNYPPLPEGSPGWEYVNNPEGSLSLYLLWLGASWAAHLVIMRPWRRLNPQLWDGFALLCSLATAAALWAGFMHAGGVAILFAVWMSFLAVWSMGLALWRVAAARADARALPPDPPKVA